MKLKFLTLILMSLFINVLSAQTVIEGSTSIDVFDEDGMNDQELSQQRPSCDLVKHRLQEFITRTSEANILMELYKAQSLRAKQEAGILEIYKRTPYFLNDRLYENVRIFYQWIVPNETYNEMKKHLVWGKEVLSSKIHWTDLYNGFLPPGFEFSTFDRNEKIIMMSFNMSYETFCLENGDLTLKLIVPGQELVLTATHKKDDL